jgi:HEPN domain-containing protein
VIDLDRHAAALRTSAAEDWAVASDLIEKERVRHALFFSHLAVEKLLKALVVRAVADIAPRIHNLVRLAEIAGLDLSAEHRDVLADLNPFSLAGRYPETLALPPSVAEARALMVRAQEVGAWLQSRL